MNRDIETILWVYIKKNFLPQHNGLIYDDNENLFETGIMDSVGLITFVSFIEEEFNLSIPDEDLLPEYFMSVGTIAAYIRSRKLISSEQV